VVVERKEQSLSAADVAEEEDAGAAAAAQPDSRAKATVASGVGQDDVIVGQGETRLAPSR
jgi:hypothetical protein